MTYPSSSVLAFLLALQHKRKVSRQPSQCSVCAELCSQIIPLQLAGKIRVSLIPGTPPTWGLPASLLRVTGSWGFIEQVFQERGADTAHKNTFAGWSLGFCAHRLSPTEMLWSLNGTITQNSLQTGRWCYWFVLYSLSTLTFGFPSHQENLAEWWHLELSGCTPSGFPWSSDTNLVLISERSAERHGLPVHPFSIHLKGLFQRKTLLTAHSPWQVQLLRKTEHMLYLEAALHKYFNR